MESAWLKHYPKGVPLEIQFGELKSIADVFDNAVKEYGDRACFSNMGVEMSFAELSRKVDDFARFLSHELRLQKGDRIAIQMPNLLQYPIVAFAALRLGLIIVNTNPLYTPYEMRHQFRDSGAKAIVILANYAHHLESIIRETQISSVVVTEIGDLFPFPKNMLVNFVVKVVKKMVPPYELPQAYSFRSALQIGSDSGEVVAPQMQLSDPAFFQYTGGTTGVAKGAVLSHGNIIANMLQIEAWMLPKLKHGEEVAIAALPLYHIFSLTVNCLAFLKYGAHNVLVTNPRDFDSFIKDLKRQPFTLVVGVNTLFNALMNRPDFGTIDFSKLKVSVAGAMSLQRSVSERWKALTNTVIVEGYGLTEASPVVCCNPIDGTDRVGTIGLPLPSTLVQVCSEEGKEVPIGESGELWVKGPQVMQGYWNRKDESEKVLVDGWLKTGDVATIDQDGFVRIVDRIKDMILVSGFNVYPNEVEEAIASHPGVLEVAAIGEPDEHSGEVVKVCVVKKDPKLTEQDVIQHARKALTSYKVPKKVEFRVELPKTNVGKILRRALRNNPLG